MIEMRTRISDRRKKRPHAMLRVAIVAAVAIAAAAVFAGRSGSFGFFGPAKPLTAAEIVAAVGRKLVLPADEAPTIATVADPSALEGQPFFAAAEKGDIVLMYMKAGKAILWRPSTGAVIAVAPISVPAARAK